MREMKHKEEKVKKIIGDFLETNKDYGIEVYVSNSITESIFGQIFITPDRIFKSDDKKCTLEWDIDCEVKFNRFVLRYEEIMDCYGEKDEYGSQTVHVIMKCGVTIDFECVGIRV